MRRLSILFGVLALLPLGLGSSLLDDTGWKASTGSPTPQSLPVIEVSDEGVAQFSDSVYGWTVSWNTDYWVTDPMPLPFLLWLESHAHAEGGPIHEVAVVRLYVLESHDGGLVDLSGYTFADTRECLNFEDGLFGGQPRHTPIEVLEGPDGEPLFKSTSERTWAVTQPLIDSDSSIEYLECRDLEPGSSYLMIAAWAPNDEAFESLTPELELILDSITIAGPEATPSVAD